MGSRVLFLRRRPLAAVCCALLLMALTLIRPFWREPAPAPPPPPPKRPVVIDPGHGGIDGGATYDGISEKGINLDVGLRVAAILRSRGLPVVMTRTTDDHLSLESYREDLRQRHETARQAGAWALVALHCNASASSSARGTLVLFQRDEPRSRVLARAIREQLAALQPEKPNLADVEYDHYYFDNSPVPTVAVELGYLTNPAERAALLQAANRQRLAEAIARALERVWDDLAPPVPAEGSPAARPGPGQLPDASFKRGV